MRTTMLPFYEFAEGIYEIDEFDCASIFVIVGENRALVLDTGTGIGDLRRVIEQRITDKPYDVVITHRHGDHIGGAGFFDEVWVHPQDLMWGDEFERESGLAFRRQYAGIIRKREDKHYPYDIDADILAWDKLPRKRELHDGQVFDLGGRRVTVYHCPGHTAGECVAIDDKSRILFAGDACNRKFLLAQGASREKTVADAYQALLRIRSMSERYDAVYNFHHDYRGFGAPLAADVLPNVLTCLKQMQDGTAQYKMVADDLFPEKEAVEIAVCQDVQVSFIQM